MKIKVYDIEKFVHEQSKGEHEVHARRKLAVMLNSKGVGLVMDTDACGYEIKGWDDTIEFPTNLTKNKKPNTFSICNSHNLECPLKEFLADATFEIMDDKTFFRWDYNPRTSKNYRDMIAFLTKNGYKGEQ